MFPSHPTLSLQADGFRLGCSPSSHSAAVGGDYRTHTAGTVRHDRNRHGTVQPSQGPTHPRYTSLSHWYLLYTHTHTHTLTLSIRSASDLLYFRVGYSSSFTIMSSNLRCQKLTALRHLKLEVLVLVQGNCSEVTSQLLDQRQEMKAGTKRFLKTGFISDDQQLENP